MRVTLPVAAEQTQPTKAAVAEQTQPTKAVVRTKLLPLTVVALTVPPQKGAAQMAAVDLPQKGIFYEHI